MPPLVDPNDHDVFILRQRVHPIVNQYEFSLPNGDGKPGEPICFVEQKRFKFKEDIRFYTDDPKSHELMRLKARQRFDPRARYDVTDPAGAKIGEIQKVFGESLIRSTYKLYDAQGSRVAKATETSLPSRSSGASSASCPTSVTSRTGCRSPTTSTSSGTAR